MDHDEDKFKIQRLRNMLQEVSELAVKLQKEVESLGDQVDEHYFDMSEDSKDQVKKAALLAVQQYLDRPGCQISMGTSRAVEHHRFDAYGGSRVFGPTTFYLKIVYDERRKFDVHSDRGPGER
jgi:hypothetical protein